jgi:hypothetical protein
MRYQDRKQALGLEAYLNSKYGDLLREGAQAHVFIAKRDSDYERLDALAKRTRQYAGFDDYGSRESLGRPISRVVSELIELSVVQHAQELDGYAVGVLAPLHRYASELNYSELSAKLQHQEIGR